MRPESPAYVSDALDAASRARSVAESSTRREYLDNWMLKSAVERQLEIMGEALKNLRKADPSTAERVPDVHAIIATRNILAHAYATVDHVRIWEVLVDDLPGVISALERLLDEADSSRS